MYFWRSYGGPKEVTLFSRPLGGPHQYLLLQGLQVVISLENPWPSLKISKQSSFQRTGPPQKFSKTHSCWRKTSECTLTLAAISLFSQTKTSRRYFFCRRTSGDFQSSIFLRAYLLEDLSLYRISFESPFLLKTCRRSYLYKGEISPLLKTYRWKTFRRPSLQRSFLGRALFKLFSNRRPL